MDNREEIVETCIPISMTRRQSADLTLTECLITLEGPPQWHSDQLTHTKALDGAFHIKNRLQELLEGSIKTIGLPAEEWNILKTYNQLVEALELL